MVRFKADKSSDKQIDESIPLEYLLGEGYYGYFFQEPKAFCPPLKADKQLLRALSRREREEIRSRVLLSKKNAEDIFEQVALRSEQTKARHRLDDVERHDCLNSKHQTVTPENQRRRFLEVLPGSFHCVSAASVDAAVKEWRCSRARKDQHRHPRYIYSVNRTHSHSSHEAKKDVIAQVRTFVSHSRNTMAQNMREERRHALEAIEASNLQYTEAVRARTRGLKDASYVTQELRNQLFRGSHQRDPMASAQLLRAVLRQGTEQLTSHALQSWASPSTQTLYLDCSASLSQKENRRASQSCELGDGGSADSIQPPSRRTDKVFGGGYRVTVPNAVMLHQFDYGCAGAGQSTDSWRPTTSTDSASPRSLGTQPKFLQLVGCTAPQSPRSKPPRLPAVKQKARHSRVPTKRVEPGSEDHTSHTQINGSDEIMHVPASNSEVSEDVPTA